MARMTFLCDNDPRSAYEASRFQQTGSIGLCHACEVGEHLHEIASIAAAQHFLAEVATSGGVEGTAFCKDIGNVDSKHFGPQITVVAGSIAAAPHMVEITGAVAGRNLVVEQAYLLQSFSLEGCGLFRRRHLGRGQHVTGQVQAGGRKILAQGVCRLEVDALQHALLQVGRHGLTRLIM